jgi:sugar transferase (PEP-CTERM/EpsH1 system associated)
MPIRIMHVVNNLGKGGLENGLVNLIERMDPGRFTHVVCTVRGLGPNADRLPRERVDVVALGDAASTSRFQTPALVRNIRRFGPDIVHSRNWGAIEAVFAGRLSGRAVIHSEHGLEAEAGANEPRRRAYLRRLAFETADRVVSVSWQLRDLHAGRTGFPARKIAVIHNGVDRSRFFPDAETRRRVREELGIRDTELCIGCVANLLPVKDHTTLLEAVGSLSAQQGDWRLLLIGEGPERARLESFISQRTGLGQRVSLLGSSSRVPELLRAMDVFVLPSVAEGMNNSLLEAMASGLAVVASDIGGNPEVVIAGESGMLFPAGDARTLGRHLVQLQTDPALRLQLAQGAVQRADQQFSIHSMVQAYEQLYWSLRPAGVPVLSAG